MRAYSQFPQPDLHRLDTQPYGLQTEFAESETQILMFCLSDLCACLREVGRQALYGKMLETKFLA